MKRQPKITLATRCGGKPFRFYTYAFNIDLYGWKVIVCYSTDIQAARSHSKFVKLLGKDRDPERMSYAFCTSVDELSVLFLPMSPQDGKVVSTGVTAHEALHAAKACLERTGVGDNEEAECYLLQAIVDEAYNFGTRVYNYEKDVIRALTPELANATLQKINEAK